MSSLKIKVGGDGGDGGNTIILIFIGISDCYHYSCASCRTHQNCPARYRYGRKYIDNRLQDGSHYQVHPHCSHAKIQPV